VQFVFQIYQYEPKVQYWGTSRLTTNATTKNEQITKMEQRDERRTGGMYVRRYATNWIGTSDPEL
jgi:hypothetical protein